MLTAPHFLSGLEPVEVEVLRKTAGDDLAATETERLAELQQAEDRIGEALVGFERMVKAITASTADAKPPTKENITQTMRDAKAGP